MARGFKMGGSAPMGGNATASDILTGSSMFVNGEEVIGDMPNIGALIQVLTSVSVPVTLTEGYHNGNGSIQIDSSEQDKIIDTNIRKNVTILGVQGTVEEGTDTSDATATSGDILGGKTGYTQGVKVTGSIPSQAAKTVTPTASAQTAVNAGTYCSGAITVGAIPNQKAATTVTPSASAQTAANAGTYMTGALTLGAIPNQKAGGAKYATTSAQTLASSGDYITSNITLGALSQSNLASANILRGKTITISNGSTNVWSVAGSNSVLKYTSGSFTSNTTTKAYYTSASASINQYVYTINPGFTPVLAIALYTGTSTGGGCLRTGATAIRTQYVEMPRYRLILSDTNLSQNSGWRFTSSAVDFCLYLSGQVCVYWIFGY